MSERDSLSPFAILAYGMDGDFFPVLSIYTMPPAVESQRYRIPFAAFLICVDTVVMVKVSGEL